MEIILLACICTVIAADIALIVHAKHLENKLAELQKTILDSYHAMTSNVQTVSSDISFLYDQYDRMERWLNNNTQWLGNNVRAAALRRKNEEVNND